MGGGMGWASGDELEWDTDGDSDGGRPVSTPLAQVRGTGPSLPQLVVDFVCMGFSKKLVLKAIEKNGNEDVEALLELLLTLSVIDESSPSCKPSSGNSSASMCDEDFEDYDFCSVDSSGEEYAIEDVAPYEEQLLALVRMGFSKKDASSAIERCGLIDLKNSLARLNKARQMSVLYYFGRLSFRPVQRVVLFILAIH